MYSRRDFGKIALAGVPLAAASGGSLNSTVGGVKLGAITFSFHDLVRTPGQDSVDQCIQALTYCGCQYCELMSTDVEPAGAGRGGGGGAARGGGGRGASGAGRAGGAAGGRGAMTPEQQAARESLRKWRVETPTSHFESVRKKFNDAGISIFAYTVNYNDQFSDDELDASFRHAKALGAGVVSSSTTIAMAQRLVPFAGKNKLLVAFHGHANATDPTQFAGPDSFAAAMKMSKYYRVNLDIGHFTAAGFDALPYIQQNHQHITHLHVKDMKKGVEMNLPWSQGDVPIKEILQTIKKNKYNIACMTEMAYQIQGPTQDEVKKNMEFMRAALA